MKKIDYCYAALILSLAVSLAPPIAWANKHPPHYVTVTVRPGSLRANIERIAFKYHWRNVVWNLQEDYRWVGYTRINAHDLPGIFEKLLQNYPLQAQFFTGNRVLVIVPRNIQ